MRVYGEAFFLMNGWMDYLCLMLTASLGRRRFRPGRALLAAGEIAHANRLLDIPANRG